MKRITAVGSLNVDLVVRAPRAPSAGETVGGDSLMRYPGGKGGNQAAAAARLALRPGRQSDSGQSDSSEQAITALAPADVPEIAVGLIGRVGRDGEGDYLLAELTRAGVDTSGVGRDADHGTGIAAITVSADTGENRIILIAGANQALTPGVLGQHHDILTAADVLLLQLEIPLPTVQTAARMGREKRAVVILDPAPARPLPGAFLRLCDFVTPNQGELALLVGARLNAGDDSTADPPDLVALAAQAHALVAQGARHVVVKLGRHGVLLVTPQGDHHVAGFPVTAVDTTAAGDTWNGAFAVALCEGQPLRVAARFANAAAALSVTRKGAQASIPSRDEVAALLATHAPGVSPDVAP
jgi:ribokinase